MAAFLKRECIPQLIKALSTNERKYLSDSKGVIETFHRYGVNCRYLGDVLRHPLLKDYHQIKIVLERIVFVKSAKHLFRMAMR